jgi:hypothetical protein
MKYGQEVPDHSQESRVPKWINESNSGDWLSPLCGKAITKTIRSFAKKSRTG